MFPLVDVSTLSLIGVFTAGLLSFFSPCILPLLPVYLARFAGTATDKKQPASLEASNETIGRQSVLDRISFQPQVLVHTLAFVIGLGTTFVLMGFGAGALGTVLDARVFSVIGGFIIILLGLHQAGVLRIPLLEREARMESGTRSGLAGSWLLGFTFSFGWTPCVGPILASVLVLSAQGGTAFHGAALMAVFTLGLAVPFLLLALFTGSLLGFFRKLSRFL